MTTTLRHVAGEMLAFPHGNWLDKERGLSQELWPDRDGDGKGDAGAAGELVEYKVTVYTSDIRCVGYTTLVCMVSDSCTTERIDTAAVA